MMLKILTEDALAHHLAPAEPRGWLMREDIPADTPYPQEIRTIDRIESIVHGGPISMPWPWLHHQWQAKLVAAASPEVPDPQEYDGFVRDWFVATHIAPRMGDSYNVSWLPSSGPVPNAVRWAITERSSIYTVGNISAPMADAHAFIWDVNSDSFVLNDQGDTSYRIG